MNEFLSFVNMHAEPLLLGAAVSVLILTLGFTLHKGKKVPGEEPMKRETYELTKRQQRRLESSIVSDGIEALLLDMFAKGQITEERYNAWRTRFEKRMGLLDLRNKPIVLTTEQRKKNAKNTLALLKKEPKHSLPKEKPKPKNVVDAILQGAA